MRIFRTVRLFILMDLTTRTTLRGFYVVLGKGISPYPAFFSLRCCSRPFDKNDDENNNDSSYGVKGLDEQQKR